jgi:eukaryotic-like serine/threonine-protein kinase
MRTASRPLTALPALLAVAALSLPAPLYAAATAKKPVDELDALFVQDGDEVEPNWARVEAVSRDLLARRTRTLGPLHPDTLKCRDILIQALCQQNVEPALGQAIGEQRDAYRALLAERLSTLGPLDPETLKCEGKLSKLVGPIESTGGADRERRNLLDAQRAVLAERLRQFGPDHPDTLAARREISGVLVRLGKRAEACREDRAVLAARERTLGPDAPEILLLRLALVTSLKDADDLAGAVRELRAVVATRESAAKPESPELCQACYDLAIRLESTGKLKEAHEFIRRAEQGRTRLLESAQGAAEAATKLRLRIERERKGK